MTTLQITLLSAQIKIFRDKIHGHQLLKRESKDVHQYKTTPLAIWRQHRFASPDGCQFTDLKEQVQAAKYKAMLKVQVREIQTSVGKSDVFEIAVFEC